MGVTSQTVFDYLARGWLEGHQLTKGQPWQIELSDDQINTLRARIARNSDQGRRRHENFGDAKMTTALLDRLIPADGADEDILKALTQDILAHALELQREVHLPGDARSPLPMEVGDEKQGGGSRVASSMRQWIEAGNAQGLEMSQVPCQDRQGIRFGGRRDGRTP